MPTSGSCQLAAARQAPPLPLAVAAPHHLHPAVARLMPPRHPPRPHRPFNRHCQPPSHLRPLAPRPTLLRPPLHLPVRRPPLQSPPLHLPVPHLPPLAQGPLCLAPRHRQALWCARRPRHQPAPCRQCPRVPPRLLPRPSVPARRLVSTLTPSGKITAFVCRSSAHWRSASCSKLDAS